MKRKWFTLLFALLAVVSFQVTAQNANPFPSPGCATNDAWWYVTADTTGLGTGNRAGNLPYSGNKLAPLPNWLVWTVKDSAGINKTGNTLFQDSKIAQFTVTKTLQGWFTFKSTNTAATGPLKLSYQTIDGSSNSYTGFEVVQFMNTPGTPPILDGIPSNGVTLGWTRTAQDFDANGVLQGYLMPAQGGSGQVGIQQDTTAGMLMVIADKNQNLSIRQFKDVFTIIPAGLAIFNGSAVLYTSYATYTTQLQSALAPALDAILVPAGQAPIGATFNRDVAYISEKYTGTLPASNLFVDFNDTTIITQYRGNLPQSATTAQLMSDPGGWTNGLPKAFTGKTINDGTFFGNSGSGKVFAVVARESVDGVTLGTTVAQMTYTPAAITNGWRPVWIKLVKPEGRWATPEDFKAGTPYQFPNLGVPVAKYKSTAGTPDGKPYVDADLSGTTYDKFTVNYVDFLAYNKGVTSGQATTEQNIFGPGQVPGSTSNYLTRFDDPASGGFETGLWMTPSNYTQPIIPLFTLSSPENGCKVVSVSRQNDQDRQSQGDGVYANRLELRTYGNYWDYKVLKDINGKDSIVYKEFTANPTALWNNAAQPTAQAGLPVLDEDQVATSLQKFAIWVDVCGNMTLYPVAAYSWQYGEDKFTQASTVLPNSVLIYNNTEVVAKTGVAADADKGWGTKVGQWNGATTANNGTINWTVTTAPNMLQTRSDYKELAFAAKPSTVGEAATIGDYWFFLDVPSASNTLKGSAGTLQAKASAPNAYQADGAYGANGATQYVLSYGIRQDGTKGLIMLPKEKVRAFGNNVVVPQGKPNNMWYSDLTAFKAVENAGADGKIDPKYLLPDYWSNNPFDSINMAAHWKAIKNADGTYKIENMLHDVLPGAASGWSASKSGDGFILTAADGSVLSLGNWYQPATGPGATYAKADSIYFQKDVNMATPSVPAFPLTVADAGKGCVSGLALKTSEIYYVPTFSGSYGTEAKNGVINTNDPNFIDADGGNGTMYKDSLTAYLYLHGSYGVREALIVDNNLLLDSLRTDDNKLAAALSASTDVQVEFIPLTSVAAERNAKIAAAGITTPATNADQVYDDTYKWFLVKKGNQYLQFDTINTRASVNRLKVGLSWGADNDIANATPVRLYQPLVGDKLQGNFVFQYYMPVNTYYATTYKANSWPDIEDNSTAASLPGKLVWGQLGGGQSNYILANVDKAKGTRFTYIFKAPTEQKCCTEQFIDPKWMADEKLLSLPVKGQLWDLTSPLGYGFATSKNEDGKNISVKEAIAAQGITELKHIYYDSIRPVAPGTPGTKGYITFKGGSGTTAWTNTINTFYGDRAVPLYFIQNADGEYLTVDTTTYQFDSHSTAKDVTGVNLVWRKDKFDAASDKDANNLNKLALQLFAISGTEQGPNAKDDWYRDCQSYVYLPLASYQAIYSTGKVDKTKLWYNTGLGKAGVDACNPDSKVVNDVREAFRVGQYSMVNRNQKNLIVQNATGNNDASNVPVNLKWQKLAYDVIGCGDGSYQLVKDYSGGFYYAAGGENYDSLCVANSNTLLAHWAIKHDATDPQLHTFAPESLLVVPGYKASDLAQIRTQLTGNYYVKIISQSGKTTTARVFDFSKYNSDGNYKIVEDTFVTTCVDHTLPFYNLESQVELPAQVAILEAPYVDRNLTDHVVNDKTTPTAIGYNSYQVYLNKIGDKIDSATYLTAYKTNVRRLAAGENGDKSGHDIPYYSFSLTKGGKEYFLNVIPSGDSVYWSTITSAQKQQILADYANGVPNAGTNAMALYKFCLPYQVNPDGTLKDSIAYGGIKYQPVYIQTLDTAIDKYPYLVVAGSATKYATAVKLDVAIQASTNCPLVASSWSLAKNIYSVDYAQIDPYKVTAWIFGGKASSATEWVPLYDPKTQTTGKASTTGLLTNFKIDDLSGVTFITESGLSPVNYGVFTGISKGQLFFEYEGTEQIGAYSKVPIYYYRIGVVHTAPADTLWLTDSYGKTGDYQYTWSGTGPWQLAFFGDKLKNATGMNYDSPGFLQTLGLRYVKVDAADKSISIADASVADQTFVVVSNANYANAQPDKYRYLAGVNNRLVFVEGYQNALVFQFGRATDGGFTGVPTVAEGEVYGVAGGVRLVNQAGNVVNFYSVDGSLIKNVTVTGADQTVVAPRGVVIVKVADKATKVIVK